MTGRPTNAASRSGIKSHVTKWINKIKDYENVSADLTIRNILLGAEQNLRGNFTKFVKLSNGVVNDMERNNATQEDFDRETEHQIKVEEEVSEALVIVKIKIDQYDKQQEEEKREASEKSIATLLGMTQKAAEIARQHDKIAADALREKDRLEAEAIREQDRLDRQQEITAQNDLIQQLINAQTAATTAAATAAAAAGAGAGAAGGGGAGVANPAPSQTTKLPKRQIKPFKGDILEWTPFWESYNAAVHQSTIPDVEKFGYLRDYLKGEAQLCVENLELTDANYAVAIATLRRTYGNQDVLIDAHMNKLDSLTQIKDASDTSALRCFQLSIQSHINALVNLGIPKTSHGGLGSRILRAIPYKLQTEWSKSATNKVTDIDHVLTFLQEQVEAAERLSRLKPQTPKAQTNGQVAKTPSTTQATASQLNVGVVPKTTPNSKSKTKKGWAAHLQKEEGRLPLQERRCFHAFFCKEMHWATNCSM